MTVAQSRDVLSPTALTQALMLAWERGDGDRLADLVHPECELETAMADIVGVTRGRDDAVQLLLEMRRTVATVEVDRVEETSATTAVVHAHGRRPLPPGGFKDGAIRWEIELRDGKLWRSRIV
jgi:ketosteroid isomerase-like protein